MTSTGDPVGELGFRSAPVQRIRRLLAQASERRSERVFIVEGSLSITEAETTGWSIEAEFTAPEVEPVSRSRHHRLGPGVLERISGVSTPPGNLAIVRRRDTEPSVSELDCVLVAHGVRDPGNLGTMIRSAEAAGVDAVAVVAESTDPYGPKVVRSTAGALFRIPVLDTSMSEVVAGGRKILASSSHRGRSHRTIDYSGKIAIVVGNESAGLEGAGISEVVDPQHLEWVRIEHHGRAESLNVAMAATLLCFEAAAGRRSPTSG